MLDQLTERSEPLTVIDTHAGAGVYDLGGDLARRSDEAEAGIGRLLADADAPAVFAPLKRALARLNSSGQARLYPGSPWLITGALRQADLYIGCELRADDYALLQGALAERSAPGGPTIKARREDGYAFAMNAPAQGRTLVLVDPPYEQADDYARIVETLGAMQARAPVSALVWAPIKDLETFDALLSRLEQLAFADGWAAEVRLRPLRNPMQLNGAAMVGLGLPPPDGVQAICDWTARAAGGEGGFGRVTPLFV